MTNNLRNLPLISIIIRSCNRAKLLEKALTSIVEQSYQSLEVIIVNEGQNSLKLLTENFSEKLSKILLIEENIKLPRGRSIAAQLGLEHCNGDYIGFLDDDDWLLPNHFQVLLNAIENSPALAVYSSIDCVREGDEDKVVHTYQSPYDHNKLFINNYIPIHAVLFDRILLEKGVSFSPEFKIYEDWDFWLQVSQHTAFKHIDTTTAIYRISPVGSGAHSNNRLQQDSRESLWQKWTHKQPANFQNDLFAKLIQQDIAISNNEQQMLGHMQHVTNQQNHIDQLSKDIQEQQNTFNEKLAVLKGVEKKQQQLLSNDLESNHNQQRINKKVNYTVIALAILGCLSVLQIALLLSA